MNLSLNRPTTAFLFVCLVSLLAARGIVPAMSKIGTDFPSYLTAAKIVADRGQVDRLYDIAWFQEQMRIYGIGTPREGKFSPHPPPTALLFLPLAHLEPLNALRVVTGVSVLSLVCSILLFSRILSWNFIDSTVFVLLSGYAVINALRLGQPYIVVSLSCILGYYAYLKGWPLLAGMCFGLFVPFKYFPVVMLIYFGCRKEWKIVLGGAVAILAVAFVSISVLGWKIHEIFLSSVLGNHLVANIRMQDPFAASFQSFDTLFRRLFVFDATSNPQPLFARAGLAIISVAITKAAILCAAVAALVKLGRNHPTTSTAPSIGIIGILTLLVAPATATYHFVLLWLPVGLLIDYLFRERSPQSAYFVIGTYALIGFFPYRFTQPFEGRGALTVIAYPRLFLLLAMLITCVYIIWNMPEPASRTTATPTQAFTR